MKEPITVYSFSGFCITHITILINLEINKKPYTICLRIVTEWKDLVKLPISNITSIIDYNRILTVNAELIDPESLPDMDGFFIKRRITNQLADTKLILEIFRLIDYNAPGNENHLNILDLVSSGTVKIGDNFINYQPVPF